jgi:hypothetical protein
LGNRGSAYFIAARVAAPFHTPRASHLRTSVQIRALNLNIFSIFKKVLPANVNGYVFLFISSDLNLFVAKKETF